MVKYFICLIVPFLFTYQTNKTHRFKISEEINYDGIYVSRDTFFSIDKNFKNEITISLLKFNKNNTVQTSIEYSYSQNEDDRLNNIAIQKCLNNFSSYYFTVDKKSNLNIGCKFKYPKKETIDFATPRSNNINQNFTIVGGQLIRKGKSNKPFKKIYALDKSLTFNFPEIKHRNACNASY